MKYFVSSDIHGYFDLWQDALKNKGYQEDNPEHKIILCGDLFDRGRQPKEIIKYIKKYENKIILIKGNHEDLAEEAIKRNQFLPHDLHNGTAQTFFDLDASLYIKDEDCFNLKQVAKQSGLTDIFKKCYNYYETDHYIFVHGYIPTLDDRTKYNPKWREATKKEWETARWTNCCDMFQKRIFEPNKTIVTGHWHCSALWHFLEKDNYDEFGAKTNFNPFITKEFMAIQHIANRLMLLL